MSTIRTGTGLFSGIDIAGLTDQLISAQRAPARRLELRVAEFQGVQAGLQQLEANVLTLSTSVSQLGRASTFDKTAVSNSDITQIGVTTTGNASLGSYSFQSLRLTSTEQRLSRGFANSDTQKIGAGTITLSQGGELSTSTRLDTFNGGEGIQRGKIKITDRSGAIATIDLSSAYTIDDVLSAINDSEDVSVTASTSGGQIVLTDRTGSTTSNLSVQEVGNTTTAGDLGLRQSVAAETLTGSEVYYITGDFTLDQINDGNSVSRVASVPDLKLTLQDGSQIEVNLDDVFNLNEFISAVNDHADNGGKVTASLADGRLVLTDNTGGGGSLSVEDLNGASVISELGLDNASVGNTLSGDRLLAGLGSRLLRNLNGGQGVTTTGQILLTDRSGLTATVDLTDAESLDEVINAINGAEDGGTPLAITARLNSTRTGIELVDSSGASANNLIVADVGGSTLAADLGIAVDSAVNEVSSGSLSLRHVSAATRLSDYAPGGAAVRSGSFLITDSAGNKASITISQNVKTLGGVLQRINAASTVQVTAKLNDTGDGFVLVDEAGGTGELKVEEVGGSTAADLRILSTGTTGSSGHPEISSRRQTVIEIQEDDTLESLSSRINAGNFGINAGVVNDGSAFNAFRLSLTSSDSGTTGRLVIDTSSVDLGLEVTTEGRDALLQVGSTAANSFLVASSINTFADVATGVTVAAKTVGTTAARVTIVRDIATPKNTLKSLVTAYNSFIDSAESLTRFDEDPTKRGILQGQGVVLRIRNRLDTLINRQYTGADDEVTSLASLGVRVTSGGKLEFDEARYDSVVGENADGVRNFFVDTDSGIATKFDSTLKALTDSIDGTFSNEQKSLQNSVDAFQQRVDQIDAVLAVRHERLLNQFIQMETIISQLQSQGDALTALSNAASSSK